MLNFSFNVSHIMLIIFMVVANNTVYNTEEELNTMIETKSFNDLISTRVDEVAGKGDERKKPRNLKIK